jgi:hypothetical protein
MFTRILLTGLLLGTATAWAQQPIFGKPRASAVDHQSATRAPHNDTPVWSCAVNVTTKRLAL